MEWFSVYKGLPNHYKTLDLAKYMNWDKHKAIGALIQFWAWCLDYAEDGDLRKHPGERIGEGIGLPIEVSDDFWQAMIKAGWIDTEPYLRVHDWWDYAGRYLRSKYPQDQAIRWRRIEELYRGKHFAEPTPEQREEEKRVVYPLDSTEMKACRYLFGSIKELDRKVKEPDWQKWCRDMHSINARDGRDWKEIRQVLDFVKNDSFWKTNILSPDKLRKQFHALVIKMNGKQDPTMNLKQFVRRTCEHCGQTVSLSDYERHHGNHCDALRQAEPLSEKTKEVLGDLLEKLKPTDKKKPDTS